MIDKKDYFLMLANKVKAERTTVKRILFQATIDLDTYLVKYTHFVVQHELVVHTRRKKFSKKTAVELISEMCGVTKESIEVQSITKLEAWTFYNG